MYFNFGEFWRGRCGSVVVRERVVVSVVSGPGSRSGSNNNRNTLNNRLKNGSVFKMAATVHERDN